MADFPFGSGFCALTRGFVAGLIGADRAGVRPAVIDVIALGIWGRVVAVSYTHLYPYISHDGDNSRDWTENGQKFDHHLRSTRVVTGSHVEASDGAIGHVEDFIIDLSLIHI